MVQVVVSLRSLEKDSELPLVEEFLSEVPVIVSSDVASDDFPMGGDDFSIPGGDDFSIPGGEDL